jgi:hypothetical protein
MVKLLFVASTKSRSLLIDNLTDRRRSDTSLSISLLLNTCQFAKDDKKPLHSFTDFYISIFTENRAVFFPESLFPRYSAEIGTHEAIPNTSSC